MSRNLVTGRGRGQCSRGPAGGGGVPGTGNSTSKGAQVRNGTGDLEKVRKDEEKTKPGLDMPPPPTKQMQCHQ